MTSLADRTIDALRAEHETLAALVAELTDAQLAGPSGASEWTPAAVLSHLGSGAEIGLAGLRGALGLAEAPAADFNQSVWDRWNALSPREQAEGVVASDEHLVAAFEALSGEQRDTAQIELGFVPFPLPIASFAGMRLAEVALHSWDVRVALDPGAEVDADSAEVLLEHYAGGLAFLLGFIGKPDALTTAAVVELTGTRYGIVVGETVGISATVADPTATFTGTPAAAVRLLGGRLTPAHTPDGATMTGAVSLDDLRAVFPGY